MDTTTDRLRNMTDDELRAHKREMGKLADRQQINTILGRQPAQVAYEAAAVEWMRRLEERGLI